MGDAVLSSDRVAAPAMASRQPAPYGLEDHRARSPFARFVPREAPSPLLRAQRQAWAASLQRTCGNRVATGVLARSTASQVRRKCGECSRSERSAAEPHLQRTAEEARAQSGHPSAGGGPGGSTSIANAGSGTVPAAVSRLSDRGGGRPLPAPLRETMEARFGFGFSEVRIHDDALAADATRSVGAIAYTLGRDIAFAPGQFQPETPRGMHLLAHELGHVVQQDGGRAAVAPSLVIGPEDAPEERAADRAADAVVLGQPVSLPQLGVGAVRRRLQRAVSKVCNPPSVWFTLGGPQNLPAAIAFGAIAEVFISADVVARTGVAPGNFYLDNPLAGPIDPAYVYFIISKNPGLSAVQKALVAGTSISRPDVLMHQVPLTEFEEVKPDSTAGRAAGRAKVGVIQTFFSGLGLPYLAGSTYTPPPPFVIVSASIKGVPFNVTFEVFRDRNGLLVYDICVETDWLLVSLLAIAAVIAIILLLILKGVIGPVPMPVPVPALASNSPQGTPTAPAGGPEAPGAAGPQPAQDSANDVA